MPIVKIFIIQLTILFSFSPSFAQPQNPTVSQITRTQELIKEEESLRQKLEEEKVFIQEIIVTGVTEVDTGRIREITKSFEQKWLKKEDFELIQELIKEEYGLKEKQAPEISYEINKQTLEFQVFE